MADAIQTFSVDCSGGMITNLSPLQQSVQFPGSARLLVNFEPTIDGGYRRISGTTKVSDVNDEPIRFPNTRTFYLESAASAGDTSIVIGNLANYSFAPTTHGTTFILNGTTYTIDTFTLGTSTSRTATITFSPPLVSNASRHSKVFLQDVSFSYFSLVDNFVICDYPAIKKLTSVNYISNSIRKTAFSISEDLPLVNGTTLINGAGQTGSVINIDGLDRIPIIGQTFYVSGIDGVFTVLSVNTYNESLGTANIAINKSITTAPSDNAVVTWIGGFDWLAYFGFENRINFTKIGNLSFSGSIVFSKDNVLYKLNLNNFEMYDQSYYPEMSGFPVAYHKNQLFLNTGTSLKFSAPYAPFDFSVANGAGEIKIGSPINDVKSFKDQLFIFCDDKILRIVGNSSSDFVLQPVTLDIGCPYPNTVQQIGGDVIFLSTDGFRLLSVTGEYGDFAIGSVSNSIKTEVDFLVSVPDYYLQSTPTFVSTIVPEKNQYRIFRQARDSDGALLETYGLIGTQSSSNPKQIEWSVLDGLNVYEIVNTDIGIFYKTYQSTYLYQMENGTSFDGVPIVATYSTPFFSFNDARLRKTLMKLTVYCDKSVSTDNIEFTTNLVLDLNETGILQPPSIKMGNTNATFGDVVGEVFVAQLVGSGFSSSIEISCTTDIPSFSIDNLVIEYMLHDRR